MSDKERERDAAWLLARERGEPGPEMPEERVRSYFRLEALVGDLPAIPAVVAPRPGWRQRAVAAINAAAQGDLAGSPLAGVVEADARPPHARTKRPRWAIPAAVATMAAALAVIVITQDWPRDPDRTRHPLIAITVEAGGSNRSAQPNVGDILVVRALLAGAGELRVYDEAGTEQARCGSPGPSCRPEQTRDGITLVLRMLVRKPDSFRVVLLSSPLAGPSAGLDADVAAAVRAGITVSTQNPIRFH